MTRWPWRGWIAEPWFALVHFKDAHRPYGLDFDHVDPVVRLWDALLRKATPGNPDRLLSQALQRAEVRAQRDAAYDEAGTWPAMDPLRSQRCQPMGTPCEAVGPALTLVRVFIPD